MLPPENRFQFCWTQITGLRSGHGKNDLWTKLSDDSLKRWHFNFQFDCRMTLNNPDNDRARNISRNIRTVRERGFSMGPGPGGEDEPMWLLFRNRWIHHVMTFKKETVELNICENMVLKMVSEFGLKFRQYCLTSVKNQMESKMTVIESNGFR